MINALILDVDGVLVGEKVGYNSPNPHHDVIRRLKAIRDSGLPIVLCTGKPHYSVEAIITGANLTNPHITNGGSVVIDPINQKISASYALERTVVDSIVRDCLTHDIYIELYTVDGYYITASQERELTRVHALVLQREPVLTESLSSVLARHDVVKLMPIVPDESGIPTVDRILAPYKTRISTSWGLHPIANPHQFCGVTATGISKRQTTLDVLHLLGIGPEHALGVGDSTSDWTFMELCGTVAAMENAQAPLKDLVQKRGEDGYIGGHVDANGILPVFDHFHLPGFDSHP